MKNEQSKTLDAVCNEFLEKSQKGEEISQKALMEEAEKNHLSEEEEDQLFEWVQQQGIFLISDEDMIDDEEPADSDEDEEFNEEDEEEQEDESPEVDSPDPYVEKGRRRVHSDSVKMYLKEIGEIDLLSAQQEYDVAKRVAEGDKEAKEILI